MKIRVRLFAALHEVVGHQELEVEVEPGTTAGELLSSLVAEHTKLVRYVDVIQVVVNQEFAERDTPIGKDDEVALLPPVSGGSYHPSAAVEFPTTSIGTRIGRRLA